MKFLKKLIWFQAIALNNQITILGWSLFGWQLYIDYDTLVNWMNGTMPYPNFWDSVEFALACGFYTFALICTLLLRVFSFPIWLIYLVSWCYVVYHLPLDMMNPPLMKTKHEYALVDALIIMHSGYFISKGLKMAELFLIKCHKQVLRWLKLE